VGCIDGFVEGTMDMCLFVLGFVRRAVG